MLELGTAMTQDDRSLIALVVGIGLIPCLYLFNVIFDEYRRK